MADKPESAARLCGRLWATLVVLRAVGEDRGRNTDLLDESRLDKAQKQPEDQLGRQLALAADYLRKARRRGARHGEAATRLFLAIPEYVPRDGRFPSSLGGEPQATEFLKAYHEQRSAYAEHQPLFK
jgi:phytoene/squalene synthetase